MDGNLFAKYKGILDETKKEKQNICLILKNEIDFSVKENQITLQKKEITLHLSSAQRNFFRSKGGATLLKERGFFIKE